MSYILCVHSLLVIILICKKNLFNNLSYQNEKQKVEKQRDGFQREVEQLRADMAVTDNEGAKEEKKHKVHSVSNANPFPFACSMNDVEREHG